MEFLLRTTVPPTAVVADVRRAVREVLKTVRIAKVTTLAEQIDASIVTERLLAALSALLGVLGTALVASGLYGLLVYRMARRVKEVGVRMALGATRTDITTMVLEGALRLAFVGLLVGVPVALAARRVAGRLLPGLSGESPFPIVLGAAAVVGVAVLAAYVPARHAAGVLPSEALRSE